MGSFFPLTLAFAAQAGMISNSVSPQPIVAVPTAPPPPTVINAVPREEGAAVYRVAPQIDGKPSVLPPFEPVTVWVRIFSGSRLLLSDRLRVARYNATDILSRSEAPGDNCPMAAGPTVQSTLTFQINREGSSSPDEFFIGLSWSRPVDECKLAGSRGLSIAQPVTIKAGQPTVVTGDGGIRVELSIP
jgi:hypothetical protein